MGRGEWGEEGDGERNGSVVKGVLEKGEEVTRMEY